MNVWCIEGDLLGKLMDVQIEHMQIEHSWRFDEYITAIAWHPDGQGFAVATAGGEVIRVDSKHQTETWLQASGSIDILAFSIDGQFLAAAGQAGLVWIWESPLEQSRKPDAPIVLDYSGDWITHLVWHPQRSQLAIAVGKSVRVWQDHCVIRLALASSALDVAWSDRGDRLAVAGNGKLQIWPSDRLNSSLNRDGLKNDDVKSQPEPIATVTLPSASTRIAWSPEDAYLAIGNFDRTVWVMPGDAIAAGEPWQMRGFPAKVTSLKWSVSAEAIELDAPNSPDSPNSPDASVMRLAMVSAEGVVVWGKSADEEMGFMPEAKVVHEDSVMAIAWHPTAPKLISAGRDRSLKFWHPDLPSPPIDIQLASKFELPTWPEMPSWCAIVWHPAGAQLLMGSEQGDVVLLRP